MFSNKLESIKQMNQMRVRMKKVEKDLMALSFEAKSKNDLVTCISDGKLNIKDIFIEDELLAKNDKKTSTEKYQTGGVSFFGIGTRCCRRKNGGVSWNDGNGINVSKMARSRDYCWVCTNLYARFRM